MTALGFFVGLLVGLTTAVISYGAYILYRFGEL
jgi:hypothetical protein